MNIDTVQLDKANAFNGGAKGTKYVQEAEVEKIVCKTN